MDKVVEQFIELIKIDSPSGREAEMAAYLSDWLKSHNFILSKDRAGNILAFLPGTGQPLLFTAHMDTVEPGRGIKPKVTNGQIQSDGTTILGADNKAPLAAILIGVEEYLSKAARPRPIELLFTVKEESGDGLNDFDFSKIKSQNGIAFDIGKDLGSIVTSSPFIANFHILFRGKAAHIRVMEEGKSAIGPLAEFLLTIQVGRYDKGDTSINIGLVNAGHAINTVAENAHIDGEVRSYTKNNYIKQLAHIKKVALKIAHKNKIQIKFWTDGYCPGYNFDERSELIQSIIKANKKLEIQSTLCRAFSVSDVNMFNHAGVKVINLGDGIKGHHTVNESVSIENLNLLKNQVITFLEEL